MFSALATDVYCTTYCNRGHRVADGKPLDHECNILPPTALKAEMVGDYDRAIKILSERPLRRHRGIKSR